MMNLSQEIKGFLKGMRLLSGQESVPYAGDRNELSNDYQIMCGQDEIINVNEINFGDDETWLCRSFMGDTEIKDLTVWLYNREHENVVNVEIKKNIDSRTFTRPKKRLNRPSIQHYNENYFKMDNSDSSTDNKYLSDSSDLSITRRNNSESLSARIRKDFSTSPKFSKRGSVEGLETSKPLDFDLSQPTTSGIFERIIAEGHNLDSFQNMSPPSLINSLCSSTFTSLMENSYIKNDPVLREIRDTDYTEAVLLQDSDPPLFKSFTESVSSLNSECYDKHIINNSKDLSDEKENMSRLNETYTSDGFVTNNFINNILSSSDVLKSSADLNAVLGQQNNIDQNASIPMSSPHFNGTYKKNTSLKHNATFRKSTNSFSFENSVNNSKVFENNQSKESVEQKRHSYVIGDTTFGTYRKKSFVGSADSLDLSSSASKLSKGSSKMLNMAEVDALILQQEQCLQQVMSTPKPSSKTTNRLWENSQISPIAVPGATGSESDNSDGYLTVRSSSDSLSSEPKASGTFVKPKGIFPIRPNTNVVSNHPTYSRPSSNTRKSISNLATASNKIRGSYGNIANTNVKGSNSNLAQMSEHLKRSYTQLKPVLKHHPVVDAPQEAPRIAEVAPTVRDRPTQIRSASCKSQVRTSTLPRPVSGNGTGIPRPVSKIPGPRTIRTLGQQHLSVRPDSRMNDDF